MNTNQAWQDQTRNGAGEFGHRIHPEHDTFTPPASGAAAAGSMSTERCHEIRDRAIAVGAALKTERDETTRRMNGAGFTAAAAAVRAKHPEAAYLRAGDDDEGGVYWEMMDSDLDVIDFDDNDGELEDELYHYGQTLTMDRPSLMEEYAMEYEFGSAFYLRETHAGYCVSRIEVDIDALLAAAENS